MKNKFLFLLLAVIAIGFSACSKQLEKVLPGTWTITQYSYTDGTYSESITNYGKITFIENGTGLFVINDDGDPYSYDFVWSSDGKETVNIDGDTYTVTVNKPKKQVFEQRFDDEVFSMTLEK